MNNQIVLVSTFCDTDEKIEILLKNIKKIKSKGLDVALISPLILPEIVIKNADFVFFTKENPILDWPTHSMYGWQVLNFGSHSLKIWQTYPDYGWAGLNHVKRLGEMFINYHYSTFAFIIYDSMLTDEHFDLIKKGHESIVYPSKRGEDIWKVGLHLMVFNREMLHHVIDRIQLKDYLSYPDFDAFAYLHNHLVIPLQIQIAKDPVEDEIYFYEKTNMLNHSSDEDVKYFISSPDEYVEEVKILFYGNDEIIKIKTIVNGIENTHTNVNNGDIISLGLLKNDIKSVVLEYDDKKFDITNKIKSIKNSAIVKI